MKIHINSMTSCQIYDTTCGIIDVLHVERCTDGMKSIFVGGPFQSMKLDLFNR